MHETGVAQGLLKMIEEVCAKHDRENPDRLITQVREIDCEAGLLAGFEFETLKECFAILAENTICQGAKLTVRPAPLECSCGQCGAAFTLDKRIFICPFCGSCQIEFKGGYGLIMQKLDVECED